jgi:8-oxo-dGTP pyrophosphatase MutT (NUDIX family)
VLSTSGKRWVVPKGRIERGDSAADTALREAWEEAGLVGSIEPEPMGSYVYDKNGQTCHVTAFLMDVTQVRDEWPEQHRRPRRWLAPASAIRAVEEPTLRALIRDAVTRSATQLAV